MERNPDLPPEELEDGVCKVREFFLPQKGSLERVPESQEVQSWLERHMVIPSYDITGIGV